jgi:hypothetical protein
LWAWNKISARYPSGLVSLEAAFLKKDKNVVPMLMHKILKICGA